MTKQDKADIAYVAEVHRRYQEQSGHGEFLVKIQNGRVMVVDETWKHRPRREEE